MTSQDGLTIVSVLPRYFRNLRCKSFEFVAAEANKKDLIRFSDKAPEDRWFQHLPQVPKS